MDAVKRWLTLLVFGVATAVVLVGTHRVFGLEYGPTIVIFLALGWLAYRQTLTP